MRPGHSAANAASGASLGRLARARAVIAPIVKRYLRPRASRRLDGYGRCSVCGYVGVFVANGWTLPADFTRELESQRLVDAFVRRESSWCRKCGASLRVRRIADVLLEHYASSATSLVELVGEPSFRRLRIAEINSIGAAHGVLAGHPRLTYAEYPEEDLMRLSHGDATFDLLLTSDTLEHVPDYRRALSETRRVLRVGGRHVFTVPLVPSRQETVVRAAADASGARIDYCPPQYHGRASGPFAILGRARNDYLTYSDFGLDIVAVLREVGFSAELHFYDDSDPDSDTALVLCAEAS